jgi:hypothetical protein
VLVIDLDVVVAVVETRSAWYGEDPRGLLAQLIIAWVLRGSLMRGTSIRRMAAAVQRTGIVTSDG